MAKMFDKGDEVDVVDSVGAELWLVMTGGGGECYSYRRMVVGTVRWFVRLGTFFLGSFLSLLFNSCFSVLTLAVRVRWGSGRQG